MSSQFTMRIEICKVLLHQRHPNKDPAMLMHPLQSEKVKEQNKS